VMLFIMSFSRVAVLLVALFAILHASVVLGQRCGGGRFLETNSVIRSFLEVGICPCGSTPDAHGCCDCRELQVGKEKKCLHHNCDPQCNCIPTAATAQLCKEGGKAASDVTKKQINKAAGGTCTGPHDHGPCWVPGHERGFLEVHNTPAAGGAKGHKVIHHCIGTKCGPYRVPLDHPLADKPSIDEKKKANKRL